MENFTPLTGLLGGALIGLAATLLLLANGRIAGISGIVGGLLSPKAGEMGWRLMFIAGLWLGALVYWVVEKAPLSVEIQTSWPALMLAGLLVGFGTRMGGGCTSGHAVCGIARFSKRSITATGVFMTSAMVTVFLTRHVIGS